MSDLAIFVHDTYRIWRVNQAGCELFRCELTALIDSDMMELIVNADFRGLAKLRMFLLRDLKRAPPMRYKYRRCDGTKFWAKVSSVYLGDDLFETTVTYEDEA